MITHCSKNKIIPYLIFYQLRNTTNEQGKEEEEVKVEVKEEEKNVEDTPQLKNSEVKRMDTDLGTVNEESSILEDTNNVHAKNIKNNADVQSKEEESTEDKLEEEPKKDVYKIEKIDLQKPTSKSKNSELKSVDLSSHQLGGVVSGNETISTERALKKKEKIQEKPAVGQPKSGYKQNELTKKKKELPRRTEKPPPEEKSNST
mmetsp:Transcript_19620/g.17352  ORF Transcript_19620/g.17352 Transcript_19620/m.17352 type:complete len:203 (+) Transcript_19620:116-724(+)